MDQMPMAVPVTPPTSQAIRARPRAALTRSARSRPAYAPRTAIAMDRATRRRSDRKSTRLNSSHRDLHSFPTRRSSDLNPRTPASRADALGEIETGVRAENGDRNGQSDQTQIRSEEHTSELQSPRSTLFPYTTLFRSQPAHAREPR